MAPLRCEPAVIHGYNIVFDKRSEKRCAAANLRECVGNKCEIVGIACNVGDKIVENLDMREKGYHRRSTTCIILGRGASAEVEAYVYISNDRLNNDEIERCIGDPRFSKYLETIAEAIIYWEEILEGFRERYLRGISRDAIHSIIANKLEELTRR